MYLIVYFQLKKKRVWDIPYIWMEVQQKISVHTFHYFLYDLMTLCLRSTFYAPSLHFGFCLSSEVLIV